MAQTYRNDTASNLSGLRQANKALQEQGTREDIPTGTTPRKRAWEYDDDWERTQDRDTVLREWRQSRQHCAKRPRLQSRSVSVESRHDSQIDIHASTPSKPVPNTDLDDCADGDETIRGEPGVANGDESSGLRSGPAGKTASDVLTGSTSSSVSVPTSASAMPGLPRSTTLPSAAVRSGAITIGVSKRGGLAKNQYSTRGGSMSSNKGVPLADRNLVLRSRKAR